MIYDKINFVQNKIASEPDSESNESTVDLSGREERSKLLIDGHPDIESNLSVVSSDYMTASD